MLQLLLLLVNFVHLIIEIYREYKQFKREIRHQALRAEHRRQRMSVYDGNNNENFEY